MNALLNWRRAVVLAVLQIVCGQLLADESVQTPDRAAEDSSPCVVLITIDGLRWQELFGGAQDSLINREWGKVRNEPELRGRFAADTDELRRQKLMPFMWSTIARDGMILGNPADSPPVFVRNGLNFSYPGYNEILTGTPDPAIDSNDKKPNSNITVLEWVHQQPGFQSRVEAVASWDVFPFIINDQRSGIPVNAGWQVPRDLSAAGSESPLAAMYEELPRVWDSVRYDYLTFAAARDSIRLRHPRLLYVAFGETDDWAHEGRYDLYLDAAFRTDRYIRGLWELLQADDFYQGRTTMLITTDHGRGDSLTGWTSHGKDLPESNQIWIAVLGPGINPGVQHEAPLSQGQIAASVAAALRLDFRSAFPDAAEVLPCMRYRPSEGVRPQSAVPPTAERNEVPKASQSSECGQ